MPSLPHRNFLCHLVIWSFFFCSALGVLCTSTQDGCKPSSYKVIDELNRQAKQFNDGVRLSDECNDTHCPIKKGWYRFKLNGSDAQVPNYCITVNSCSTKNPIWLRLREEQIPSVGKEILYAPLCINSGGTANCTKEIQTRIKNCGSFLVYCIDPKDILRNSRICLEIFCPHHRLLDKKLTLSPGGVGTPGGPCFMQAGDDWTVSFNMYVTDGCFLPQIEISIEHPRDLREGIPYPNSTIIDTGSCIRCPGGTCTEERCGYTNGPNGEANVRIYFMNVKRTATVKMHEHIVGVKLRSKDPRRKDYEREIGVLPAIVATFNRPDAAQGSYTIPKVANDAPLVLRKTTEAFYDVRPTSLKFCVKNLDRPFILQVDDFPPANFFKNGTKGNCTSVTIKEETKIMNLSFSENSKYCTDRKGYFLLSLKNQNQDGNLGILLWVIIGLIIIAIAGACLYLFIKRPKKKQSIKAPSEKQSSHAGEPVEPAEEVEPVKEKSRSPTKSSSWVTSTATTVTTITSDSDYYYK